MSDGPKGSIAAISELKLDRRLLTLFVVGAGFGESVLVALPHGERWIIIDGAAPSSSPPAKEILERYWTEGSIIELLLLTHPHADHHAGMIKILDDETLAPAIRRVGCVSHYLGVAKGNSLGREVEAAFETVDVDDPEARRELGRARNVLERIGDEWLKNPELRWKALRGASLNWGDELRVSVLGPSPEHVEDFFSAPELGRRILHCANDLSVVLELRFGTTRILLGGDLPDRRGEQLVASGWSHVCSLFPDLNAHHGYKIAHHASKEAIHPSVVNPAFAGPRSWMVTPFNKQAHRLPRFEDEEGADRLLGCEQELMLTALPMQIREQRPMPERVRRGELGRAILSPRKPHGRLSVPVASGPAVRTPPAACVWAIQFDAAGRVVARYRGAGATVVV